MKEKLRVEARKPGRGAADEPTDLDLGFDFALSSSLCGAGAAASPSLS
jgi:hypothetical protein